MRVTANEELTFYYGMVPYTVPAGAVIKGGAALHLIECGAAVTEITDSPTDELNIDGKIEDVLAWVGDDAERALIAHEAEEARGDKARSTLLTKLAEIVQN